MAELAPDAEARGAALTTVSRWWDPVREARLGVLLALLWACWGLAFALGETIPVSDGLGWDGVRFARMVEGGPELLRSRDLNSYYVHRVGPPFAVRALLLAAGVEIDASSIRSGFLVLNLTLLSLALVLLLDAANRVGLSVSSRWILCLGLFLNPANGRLAIYYAPLGDSTAFFLGSLLLWGYLARRQAAVVAALALGIFSWSAVFLLSPLLLWPRSDAEPAPASLAPLSRSHSRWVLAAAAPLGLGLLALLGALVEMPPVEAWTRETASALALNGLLLGCAAGFPVALALLNWRRVRPWPAFYGLIALVLLLGLSATYVRMTESGSLATNSRTFGRGMMLFARWRPLAAVAGHAAYFSALAIAAMAVWPRVLRTGWTLGQGAFFSLALCGLIALFPESRVLSAYWPLVGFAAIVALDRWWREDRRFTIFVAASVALSKLWWPLTGPNLLPAAYEPGNYYNTQGPSMSVEAYLVNGLAALLLGGWVWFQAVKGADPEDPITAAVRTPRADGLTSSQ